MYAAHNIYVACAADLVYESPVSGHPSKPPLSSEDHALTYLERLVHEGDAGLQAEASSSGRPGKKNPMLNTKSLRICNNQLLSLQGLDRALYHVMDQPSELEWLDASCNQLPCIEDVIVKFPKLKVGRPCAAMRAWRGAGVGARARMRASRTAACAHAGARSAAAPPHLPSHHAPRCTPAACMHVPTHHTALAGGSMHACMYGAHVWSFGG